MAQVVDLQCLLLLPENQRRHVSPENPVRRQLTKHCFKNGRRLSTEGQLEREKKTNVLVCVLLLCAWCRGDGRGSTHTRECLCVCCGVEGQVGVGVWVWVWGSCVHVYLLALYA